MLKIIINTDLDLTPPGKRAARIVHTDRGGRQIRWYVSGRIYNYLPVTDGNARLTQEWLDGT